MELIKIPIGNRIIVLKQKEFDSDIDIDEITQIQYQNLYGEIVTVSALLNKVGLLKADVDNEYEEYKLDCQVFESETRRRYISGVITNGEKKPTEQQSDDYLNTHSEVTLKRKRLLTIKKSCDYINALYWAIQSKDRKLSVLMKGVTPEEFAEQIVEGQVNCFFIKKFKPAL